MTNARMNMTDATATASLEEAERLVKEVGRQLDAAIEGGRATSRLRKRLACAVGGLEALRSDISAEPPLPDATEPDPLLDRYRGVDPHRPSTAHLVRGPR